MFHHHHQAEVSVVAPPRVRTVRLLETDEDLQAAVERASAFERARASRSGQALRYERYQSERSGGLADVLHIESEAVGA
jgi:hypothetical protein